MNPTEKEMLLRFLDDLSDHMGNAGCNDLELENTPENYELVTKAEDYCSMRNGESPRVVHIYKNKIFTTDFIVLAYLVSLIKNNSK